MRKVKLLAFCVGALVGSIIIFGNAEAQKLNYPVKPVEMIVSYPAGGGADTFSRILAKHTEKYWAGKIVVVNKVGGGGVIGNAEIARSKPDGYTVGYLAPDNVTHQWIAKGCPYTYKDFFPVVMMTADPLFLLIKNSLNMDFKQFIEYVRKSPGKVSIGMGGNWSAHDFLRAKMEKAIGIHFLKTPFQGGAPAAQAVAGGHVDSSTAFIAEGLPLIEGKLVNPVAVSSAERLPAFPNIPTIREQGYDVVHTMWRGISVPPKTPKEIVDILEEAFTKTFNDPEFRKDLQKAGVFPIFKNHKEFVKYYNEEAERYAALLKELGVVAQ